MMKYLMTPLTVLFCCVVFLCGCQTDYSEEAADKAREYALKELHGLNEEQVHFIRYTQPVFYSNVIFERKIVMPSSTDHIKRNRPQDYPIAPSQDLMHHCIVWAPPGLDGKVVVVGEGERSFRFWQPIRVIVKDYIPDDYELKQATESAVFFAENDMLYLLQSELNRVKYSHPEVLYTKFPMTFRIKNDGKKELSPWESYLEEKLNADKKETILTQISLVWKSDEPGKQIVITGFSEKGTLYLWRVHDGRYVKDTDLKAATLSQDEYKKIAKEYGPQHGKLRFPEEKIGDRGNRTKESGSIFGGNIKF